MGLLEEVGDVEVVVAEGGVVGRLGDGADRHGHDRLLADEAAKDRDVVEPSPVPVTVGAVTESSYDTAFGDDDLDIPDFLK